MFKSILKVEARSRMNYFKALDAGKSIMYVFLAFIILMLFVPMMWTVLSTFLNGAEETLIGQATALISLFMILVLSLFLVNGIIKELFMDKNIDSYLVLPVKPKIIFMVKMTYQFTLKVVPFVLLLGLIFGVTLAVRYGAPLLFLSNVIYFLFIGAVSITMSYVLVFLVTKISSAKRVGEILTLVGGLASVLPYVVITIGGQYIMRIITLMPDVDFLYRGFLYDFELVKYTVLLLLFGALGLVLTWILLNYVTDAFVTGRASSEQSKRKKRVSFDVESPIKALFKKDIMMTLRDFKEWSVILPQYLFPFVFLFLLISDPFMSRTDGVSNDHMIISVSFAGSIMISLFVGAMNTARDARTYAFLKMLPISGHDIAKAKHLYNFITIAPMYIVITLIIYFILDVAFLSLIYAVIISVLLVLTVAPIGMLLGTINPVVSRKNPAQRLDVAANIVISVVIFSLIFLLGYITQFMVEFDGTVYTLKDDVILIVIGSLIVTSFLSYVFLLKRVGRKYDKGYNITYKD